MCWDGQGCPSHKILFHKILSYNILSHNILSHNILSHKSLSYKIFILQDVYLMGKLDAFCCKILSSPKIGLFAKYFNPA